MNLYPANDKGIDDSSDFIYQLGDIADLEKFEVLQYFPDVNGSLLRKKKEIKTSTNSGNGVLHSKDIFQFQWNTTSYNPLKGTKHVDLNSTQLAKIEEMIHSKLMHTTWNKGSNLKDNN